MTKLFRLRVALPVALACSLAGNAGATVITIDADAAADGQDLSTFFSGVTLSAIGGATVDGKIYGVLNPNALTGTSTFAWWDGFEFPITVPVYDAHFARPSSPAFRADFSTLASSVSIDYETDSSGQIEAFDSTGTSLGIDTNGGSSAGTLMVSDPNNQIRYIVVNLTRAAGNDFGTLDNLVVTTNDVATVPEPGALVLLGTALVAAGFTARRRAPRG